MPYPFTFRPSTTAFVVDSNGNTDTSRPLQLFKPLLGCDFNSTPGPEKYLIPAGSTILRGILSYDNSVTDLSIIGPQYWVTVPTPYMFLDEDDAGSTWFLLDGIVWNQGGNDRLLSFYAAKIYGLPNPSAARFDAKRVTMNYWKSSHIPTNPPDGTLSVGLKPPGPESTPFQSITANLKRVVYGIVNANAIFSAVTPAFMIGMFLSWTDALGLLWYYKVTWYEWDQGTDDNGSGDLQLVMVQCTNTGAQPRT